MARPSPLSNSNRSGALIRYTYGQATARSCRAQAASRRTLFRILPEPLFGSSVSENWMLRGTLKLASDRRQYAINSSAVRVFPGLGTTTTLYDFAPFRIEGEKKGQRVGVRIARQRRHVQ